MHKNVYRNFICNNFKMETTQLFIKILMDKVCIAKQDMIHT